MILIIDDMNSLQEGGIWGMFCEEYDVLYRKVVRDTKEQILASLVEMFQDDPDLVFNGTVLDVIYRGQAGGGIELWEELENMGFAERCGQLLVTTKLDSEEVVEFVESRGAMLNTRLAKAHKKAVFSRFLRDCGLIQ